MKKTLLILALLLVARPAWADQVLGGTVWPGTSGTRYAGLMGGDNWDATEANVTQIIPTGGKIKNLYAEASGTSNATHGHTLTLMLNGVATDLACTMTGATVSCSDTADKITVAAGDTVSMRWEAVNTPSNRAVGFTVTFANTTTKETIFMASSEGGNFTNAYYAALIGETISRQWESNVRIVSPVSGTLKGLRVTIAAVPGDGKSVTFTTRKNGASQTQAVTIANTATTGTDAVNTVSVAAGDLLAILISTSNTPTVSTYKISAVFEVGTAGQFVLPWTNQGTAFAATATVYGYAIGAIVPTNDETSNRQRAFAAFTLKNMYVQLNAAPGEGDSYAFTSRINQVDAALTCTISGAADTACNHTTDVTVSLLDDIMTKVVPADTPTARVGTISYLGYLAETEVSEAAAARRMFLIE